MLEEEPEFPIPDEIKENVIRWKNYNDKKEARDTIHFNLKKQYYKGKLPPFLPKEYDALGFDVDNCMVEYHFETVVRHAVSVMI